MDPRAKPKGDEENTNDTHSSVIGSMNMLIGVPKEVKIHEYRVGLVPGSVRELIHHGHKVIVQKSAGSGIGFEDADYEAVGAQIPDRSRRCRRRLRESGPL